MGSESLKDSRRLAASDSLRLEDDEANANRQMNSKLNLDSAGKTHLQPISRKLRGIAAARRTTILKKGRNARAVEPVEAVEAVPVRPVKYRANSEASDHN